MSGGIREGEMEGQWVVCVIGRRELACHMLG
jgi:hypothetical protein